MESIKNAATDPRTGRDCGGNGPRTGSNLLALAERCEQATGPDRELDVLIEIECGEDGPAIVKIMAGSPHNTIDAIATYADRSEAHVFFRVPTYTASLDAAMTLVPEGWGFNVIWPNVKARESGILRRDAPCQGEVQFGCEQRHIVAAATPALALCAAALRARANQTQEIG